MSYTVQCDVLLCIYRRSAMDYRCFAEAEAELQKELAGIRDPGGVDIEVLAPKTSSKDIGLSACMPHAIEPILLEDNQVAVRILESGKSPAFGHADKTQRINLGWIAEQFRRRHYKMAYISCRYPYQTFHHRPLLSRRRARSAGPTPSRKCWLWKLLLMVCRL